MYTIIKIIAVLWLVVLLFNPLNASSLWKVSYRPLLPTSPQVDSSQSFTIQTMIKVYPSADTVGVHWIFYDLAAPETRFNPNNGINNYTMVFSGDLFVSADIGSNFPDPVPQYGDTIIMFGSCDTCYNNSPGTYATNPNHTGFYWLYSDIALSDPTTWQDDTLRPMPFPIAAQVGTNIEIAIPNPNETRYSGQTAYDVLGYWLKADTMGTGTPANYDMLVAFIPVQGNVGDTTVYSHPVSGNYSEGQTVYWAYHLVARPDTGGSVCPGCASYYLSHNSNPLIIIGSEEMTTDVPDNKNIPVYPNPFNVNTTIWLALESGPMSYSVNIYSASGQFIKHLDCPGSGVLQVAWDGRDHTGKSVTPGVYFIHITTESYRIIRKVIKLE